MIYGGEKVPGMRRYTVTTDNGNVYTLSAHDARDAATQAEILADRSVRVTSVTPTGAVPAIQVVAAPTISAELVAGSERRLILTTMDRQSQLVIVRKGRNFEIPAYINTPLKRSFMLERADALQLADWLHAMANSPPEGA